MEVLHACEHAKFSHDLLQINEQLPSDRSEPSNVLTNKALTLDNKNKEGQYALDTPNPMETATRTEQINEQEDADPSVNDISKQHGGTLIHKWNRVPKARPNHTKPVEHRSENCLGRSRLTPNGVLASCKIISTTLVIGNPFGFVSTFEWGGFETRMRKVQTVALRAEISAHTTCGHHYAAHMANEGIPDILIQNEHLDERGRNPLAEYERIMPFEFKLAPIPHGERNIRSANPRHQAGRTLQQYLAELPTEILPFEVGSRYNTKIIRLENPVTFTQNKHAPIGSLMERKPTAKQIGKQTLPISRSGLVE
ncbi:hypothetical protein DFH06DRAFT_1145755 [Mycena polygramma]|nr:hypothetical protein DFH06DRAFT_1145755 [Mycena polygramma]